MTYFFGSKSHDRSHSWDISNLEQRILLAGDAAAAYADAAPAASPTAAEVSSQLATESVSSSTVVFIDAAVSDVATLQAAAVGGAEVILLDANENGIEQISTFLASRKDISSVHIISHGKRGAIQLGNQTLAQQDLKSHAHLLSGWKTSLTKNADVLLYGCHTGEGDTGTAFVAEFAKLTGADVAASTDKTGATKLDGDWQLETEFGQIESTIVFGANELVNYHAVLALVDVFAAGDTGTENFELLVNDEVVSTFYNVGGNFGQRDFVRFTYTSSQEISAQDISVRFINDSYQPEIGFDRNLYVSKIVVDGQTFETEAVSTYSTGYWGAAGFTGPGFLQTEVLNTNGTFSYDQLQSSSGTRVEVDARGQIGDEILEIRVDGVAVQQFQVNNTTANQQFSYDSTETLTADRIQIAFTNDRYEPENGIDSNLTIDALRLVDRESGETQVFNNDQTTFSTGTWTADDGITAGFGRGNTLNANGYFEFASANDTDPLDASFGDNGMANFDEQGRTPEIAFGPSGQIATASSLSTGRDVGFTDIHMFTADGQRDTGFGNNGRIRINAPRVDLFEVLDDGSILVGNNFSSGSQLYELRMINPDGTLNTNYGTNGVLAFNGIRNPTVTMTPDGSLLLIAQRENSPFLVERYDINGNRDWSYGQNGTLTLPADFGGPVDVRFLDWGAAVLNGASDIAQVTPAGWLDQSFGNQGIADKPVTIVDGFEIDSQNRIVMAGDIVDINTGQRTLSIVRLTTTGEVDSSFQQMALQSIDTASFQLGGIAIDSSDRVVGGRVAFEQLDDGSFQNTRSIFRLDAFGNLDESFNTNGEIVDTVTTSQTIFQLQYVSVEFDAQGRLIVGTVNGLKRLVF